MQEVELLDLVVSQGVGVAKQISIIDARLTDYHLGARVVEEKEMGQAAVLARPR
jgi:hypothetical protein